MCGLASTLARWLSRCGKERELEDLGNIVTQHLEWRYQEIVER
jgi:hypothetical protein